MTTTLRDPTERATRETTYREALREAHREAMRRDDRVFLMGEDVGPLRRLLRGEPRPARGVRRGARSATPRCRSRRSPAPASAPPWAGMRPIVEIMTVNFSLLALDQILNNAATLRHMSGGQLSVPGRHPDDDRRRAPARGAALAQPRGVLRPHPRPDRGRTGHPRGRPRHALAGAARTPTRWSSSSTARSTTSPGELPEEPDAGRHPPRRRAPPGRRRRAPRVRGDRAPGAGRRRGPGRSAASTPRSSTCACSGRSTTRPSSGRSRAPTAPSSSTRGGAASGCRRR